MIKDATESGEWIFNKNLTYLETIIITFLSIVFVMTVFLLSFRLILLKILYLIVSLSRSNPPQTLRCWLDLSTFAKDLSGLICSVMEVMLLDIFHACVGLAATVRIGDEDAVK